LKPTAADGSRDMQAMNAIGGAMTGQQMPGVPSQDFNKLFGAERDHLELVEHFYVDNDVEGRYLRRYGYEIA
jgi:hypothetical protein